MMKKRLKNNLIAITYAFVLLFIIMYKTEIFGATSYVLGLLMPFIYGLVLAYIINWPYVFFKDKVFNKINMLNQEKHKKLKNILSLITSYIVVLGIIAFLLIIIIPQIISSIEHLVANFSSYLNTLGDSTNKLLSVFKLEAHYIENIKGALASFFSNIDKFADMVLPRLFSFTKSFTLGIYNFTIGIVVSMYLLGSKDKLLNQTKKAMHALIPEKANNKILEIGYLSHSKFGKFIAGKILDSLIIGILCFIGMSVLRIPYSLLISVVIGITNIIPFFGPFIGAIPSVFILLIIDPIDALWFTIFIFLLQQLDGNVIGPKILGNTIGISGLWIMFSVIIGGGLFGIIGMIIGVPLFAVLYTIIGDMVNKKLNKKTPGNSDALN